MKIAQGYGRRVAAVRQDVAFSQHLFACMALSDNASANNIGRIEREDVTPRIQTVAKIASFGGVSLDWLLTGNLNLRPNDIVKVPGVGQRIAQVRKQRGLTMLQLAKKAELGDSAQNVRRLEIRKHQPRKATLAKIAKALNVSTDYLAFGS